VWGRRGDSRMGVRGLRKIDRATQEERTQGRVREERERKRERKLTTVFLKQMFYKL
jgi:hypothetical protein